MASGFLKVLNDRDGLSDLLTAGNQKKGIAAQLHDAHRLPVAVRHDAEDRFLLTAKHQRGAPTLR